MSFGLPAETILVIAALLIGVIWLWDIWGQNIREWFDAQRHLRRIKKERRKSDAFVADCFQEYDDLQRERLERLARWDARERERREREAA